MVPTLALCRTVSTRVEWDCAELKSSIVRMLELPINAQPLRVRIRQLPICDLEQLSDPFTSWLELLYPAVLQPPSKNSRTFD